jgi:hypothetical protein
VKATPSFENSVGAAAKPPRKSQSTNLKIISQISQITLVIRGASLYNSRGDRE